MEITEIEERVENAIQEWRNLPFRTRSAPEVTHGAINAMVQIIYNVKKDPSPKWRDMNLDNVQDYIIKNLPLMMFDFERPDLPYRRVRWKKKITSWEVWEGLHVKISDFCPIPDGI